MRLDEIKGGRDPSEIRVGFEFEFHCDSGLTGFVSRFKRKFPQYHIAATGHGWHSVSRNFNTDNWYVETDGGGPELVTPILNGAVARKVLEDVLVWAASVPGITTDSSRGLHTNISGTNLSAIALLLSYKKVGRQFGRHPGTHAANQLHPLMKKVARRVNDWIEIAHDPKNQRAVAIAVIQSISENGMNSGQSNDRLVRQNLKKYMMDPDLHYGRLSSNSVKRIKKGLEHIIMENGVPAIVGRRGLRNNYYEFRAMGGQDYHTVRRPDVLHEFDNIMKVAQEASRYSVADICGMAMWRYLNEDARAALPEFKPQDESPEAAQLD